MREFGEFSLTPIFRIPYTITKKYYPGEPVNIYIQSLINIIQENNWFITTKNGKGKLPFLCVNVERVITIYVVQEKHISKPPESFGEQFEYISMNRKIEAEKFELETTFEKNIDDIKAYHMKCIAYIGMNISAITSNKPYLSSEHLNADIMTWILLKSHGKSPQFTKHLSSMHLEGNT